MSTDSDAQGRPLWIETPLLYSSHLSDRLGSSYAVYLKLENLQPGHSFKSRGISHFIQHQLEMRGSELHVVCASSGNAGIAAAGAAQKLGVRCTIFLHEGVDARTQAYLRALGAAIAIHGTIYGEALLAAKTTVREDPKAVLVPSYDDALVWEGHGPMVSEIKAQLPSSTEPDAILCSVGGGGLLGGIIVGCKVAGWDNVPLIALETHGSNCFFESMVANKLPERPSPENVALYTCDTHGLGAPVAVARLHKLTSKAASLGATEASASVVRMALDRAGGVRCITVPDEMSMQITKAFANDHKMLVELACATTLAPAYAPGLMPVLVPPVPGRKRIIVFIVCGGFKISVEDLQSYTEIVRRDPSQEWSVKLDTGETLWTLKWT